MMITHTRVTIELPTTTGTLGDIMQTLGDRFPGIEIGEPKDGEAAMVLLIPHTRSEIVSADEAVTAAADAVTAFVETIPTVAGNNDPAADTKYVIVNGWLCENVNEHTCGTDPDGHYGQHEPGCGLVPLGTIDELLSRPSPATVRADRDDQWVTMLRASRQIASGLLTTLDLIAAEEFDADTLLSRSIPDWTPLDETEGGKK